MTTRIEYATSDIYERHQRAVETWRNACRDVEFAEKQRDEARTALDDIGQELLASCANATSKPEKKTRRRRIPKQDSAWIIPQSKANGDARETL